VALKIFIFVVLPILLLWALVSFFWRMMRRPPAIETPATGSI
jgi:hypothetical protein